MNDYLECIVKFQNGIEVGYREELVRCKDCTNAWIYDGNEVICTHIDSNGNDKHSIDWFCADGEKRTD